MLLLSKLSAFRGSTLLFFVAGTLALLIVPFLTWFTYGLNFLFPPHVSLVYLFEWQARGGYATDLVLLQSPLVLYLAGVASTIVVVAVVKRPVFFQGLLPAVYPIFIAAREFVLHYRPVQQIFTIGLLTSFLGSMLLECSYFSYCKMRKSSKTPSSKPDAKPFANSF